MFLAGLRAAASGVASFTITWDAPETDADGSAVATLTHHRVYYSQDIDDGADSAGSTLIAMPTLTATVTGLDPGVWYAWVAAISAEGESDISPPFEVTAA